MSKKQLEQKVDLSVEKSMPRGLAEFSKLREIQPVVAIFYAGIKELGTSKFALFDQIYDQTRQYISCRLKESSINKTYESGVSDRTVIEEINGKKKEVVVSRCDEIKFHIEKLVEYIQDNDLDGVKMCLDRIKVSSKEIQKDVDECQLLLSEIGKYKGIEKNVSGDLKDAEEKSTRMLGKLRQLLETFEEKDYTPIINLSVKNSSELKKFVQRAVDLYNNNIDSKLQVGFNDAFYKLGALIVVVRGYLWTTMDGINKIIDFAKDNEIDEREAKLVKRFDAVIDAYAQFFSSSMGLSFVFSNMPSKFTSLQKRGYDFFVKYLELCVGKTTEQSKLLELEKQIAILSSKRTDPFIVSLVGAVDCLKTKSLVVDLSSIDIEKNDGMTADDDLIERIFASATND